MKGFATGMTLAMAEFTPRLKEMMAGIMKEVFDAHVQVQIFPAPLSHYAI